MHMMLLFQIIIVLLIASTTVADDSGPDSEQVDFIDELNEERARMAETLDIKVMHKLVYNKALADLAETMTNGEGDEWEKTEGFGREWRYIYFASYENGIADLKDAYSDYTTVEGLDKNDPDAMKPLDPLVPLQSQIGCGTAEDDNDSVVICLLGPEGSPDSLFSNKKRCPNGYKNVDGLCTSKEENEEGNIEDGGDGGKEEKKEINNGDGVETDETENQKSRGNQSQFIADLNQVRRKVALRKGYPICISCDSLAKEADRHVNQGENVKCLSRSCRITRFDNYLEGAKDLDDRFEKYEGMSNTEKESELNPPNKDYIKPLEHLVPLQTDIGCAERRVKKSRKYDIFCLLGPKGTLNASFINSRSVPGSDCPAFYLNVTGLCVYFSDKEIGSLPDVDSGPSENTSPIPDDSSNPSSKHSTKVANTTVTPVTAYVYVWPTTVETELDRLIAKYKREEKEGDLPSGEEVEDGAFSNFSIMVSVIFVVFHLI